MMGTMEAGTGSVLAPAERSVMAGIQIFRIVGGLLVVFFCTETLAALLNLQLRDPSSELRFCASMADRIPLGLLGWALLFLHPRYFRIKAERLILMILAWLPLGLAGIYLILIPISMNAAARLFRISSYNLNAQMEEQLKRVKIVEETTLNLPESEQQKMVDRYNTANPKKTPVDLPAFLRNLKEEVAAQEQKLNEERQTVMNRQKKVLFGSQFGQLVRSIFGITAWVFLWKAIGWARRDGQKRLGQALAGSSRK